ncbi:MULTISPECIES: spore-associated protein A [Nocardiopsis]|uniref:Spore-associated protein A n=1 Tax=Nocardiopsis sinuspersici TaxID=501010 RepID=A0A1V3BYG6_9ACTN|nr:MULTISPECIES: spore-associated protein A [Nocardiopsis]OOC53591.1 spore-associated protein A [Nocardiopsis sinuspersici]
MFKKFRNAALLTAALATGSLALASPASAAGPVASYNNACGSGYGVVNYANVGSKGTVFLTYNNSTGYNCAVTVRANPGAAVEMVVSLKRTSDPASEARVDSGYYTTYAGPVYRSAAGSCVDWYGYIDGANEHRNETNCG